MSESRVIPPLRIAVLGDFEGMHTRRWLEVFVERGHEVHAISYYWPRAHLPGVHVHSLKPPPSAKAEGFWTERPEDSPPAKRGGLLSKLRGVVPPNVQRHLNAMRYRRAGLTRVLDEIKPDVFHAHYAVEHGFYGSKAGFHPYVVSTWGSDLLVESHTPLGRSIAKRALHAADLVTGNDDSLVRRAVELGVPPERSVLIHLGIDRIFLEAGAQSVNLQPAAGDERVVISTRAHEPLYNLDVLLRAFAMANTPEHKARLIVAGTGSQQQALQRIARELNITDSVQFAGQQSAARLAELLASAHVYVSVPSSDSLALSNLEAMAAGAFPVVSDLPSVHGWIDDGVTGLRVNPGEVAALAEALRRAWTDDSLRQAALGKNRAKVEAEGLREKNMLLMERHYYRLAGHPMAGSGEAI
jgi:glycosyltransferase involved in cell wall biosynthesis